MIDYMQHYYADEPECVWCGHYGPVDDPDEPCARRVDVARAVWKLRQSERALREQLKALLGTTNADKSQSSGRVVQLDDPSYAGSSPAAPVKSPPRPDTRSGLADCEQLGGPAAPVTAGENPAGGVFGSAGLESDHARKGLVLPPSMVGPAIRAILNLESVKPEPRECGACEGTGIEPGSDEHDCLNCSGTGKRAEKEGGT